LLHHFPTKEALIEAVIAEVLAQFKVRVEHYAAREEARPGRLLRAYVRATYEETPTPVETLTMLVATLQSESGLRALLRQDFEQWQVRLEADGIRPARAAIVRQAADAYWSEQLLGITPDGEARAEIIAELLRLTEEA
jgi:AcrR family transcriptional regulator